MDEQVQPSSHLHECPVTGCHKPYNCVKPECVAHYFKNCAAHALPEPKKSGD